MHACQKELICNTAIKRWRVATLKIQAAQRFVRMVHSEPDCSTISSAPDCRNWDTTIDESKKSALQQLKSTYAPYSNLANGLRISSTLPERPKSLYFWEYTGARASASILPLKGTSSFCVGNVKQTENLDEECTVSTASFDPLEIIGSGSSGQVYLVRHKSSGNEYAMKVMNKGDIISKKRIERLMLERDILCKLNKFRLVTTLKYAFHTQSDLNPFASHCCFVLEYCNKGNLHQLMLQRHQQTHGLLTDSQVERCMREAANGNGLETFRGLVEKKSKRKDQQVIALQPKSIRFILAEVVTALNKIHSLGYVFRDLKPQNVLVHEDGHIRIGDFGVSKVIAQVEETSAPRTSTFVGTVEYMAPEIVSGDSQNVAVDWWAFGILSYELLYGETPFRQVLKSSKNSEKDLFFSIMQPEYIKYPVLPRKGLERAVTLIKRQLRVNPQKRMLGSQMQSSRFFRRIQWDKLDQGIGLLSMAKSDSSRSLRKWSERMSGTFFGRSKSCSNNKFSSSSDLDERCISGFHSGRTYDCQGLNSELASPTDLQGFAWGF